MRWDDDYDIKSVMVAMGKPDALTIRMVADAIASISARPCMVPRKDAPSFYDWITDRKNMHQVPIMLEGIGYRQVWNSSEQRGRWKCAAAQQRKTSDLRQENSE